MADFPLLLARGERFSGFDELPTPSVVVDEGVLGSNIGRMAERSRGRAALHPHAKTHKSLAVMRMQAEAGTAGLTASRAAEAAVFVRAGFGPVTVAYPMIDPDAISRLLRLGAESGVGVRFIVDSFTGSARLAQGSAVAGIPAEAFIKVDVGLHRCGVDPDGDGAFGVAEAMERGRIETLGLLSHAGHAYAAGNPEEIAGIVKSEVDRLADLRSRLRARGFPAPLLSVGSTPTLLAAAVPLEVDEVRPGNYVFLDLTAVRLGIAGRDDIALGVAAKVISAGADRAVIDAGSKTLSSDLGAHGAASNPNFGEAWAIGRSEPAPVLRLSEEHAVIDNSKARLQVGDALVVLPNHACPVVNLAGGFVLLGAHDATWVAAEATNVLAEPAWRRSRPE
jgi:D-serine deaminase-like pyridoxal phosphate-dependent protein